MKFEEWIEHKDQQEAMETILESNSRPLLILLCRKSHKQGEIEATDQAMDILRR